MYFFFSKKAVFFPGESGSGLVLGFLLFGGFCGGQWEEGDLNIYFFWGSFETFQKGLWANVRIPGSAAVRNFSKIWLNLFLPVFPLTFPGAGGKKSLFCF